VPEKPKKGGRKLEKAEVKPEMHCYMQDLVEYLEEEINSQFPEFGGKFDLQRTNHCTTKEHFRVQNQ